MADPPRIAIFGQANSFAHELARREFPSSEYVFGSVSEVIQRVDTRVCERGIVPLANTYALTADVPLRYSELMTADIVATKIPSLEIHLVLASADQMPLEAITKLIVFPVLLPQTSRFRESRLGGIKVIETDVKSTPHAAELAAQAGPGVATVCSESAALAQGLTVLERNVENSGNRTYFLALSKTGEEHARELILIRIGQARPSDEGNDAVLRLLSRASATPYAIWRDLAATDESGDQFFIAEVDALDIPALVQSTDSNVAVKHLGQVPPRD